MAKEIIDLHERLRQYKFDCGLLQKIDCSSKENKEFYQLLKQGMPLPDGIFQYKSDNASLETFYRVYTADLTESETAAYLTYCLVDRQLNLLESIKGYLHFFAVLAIIGIILALITMFVH